MERWGSGEDEKTAKYVREIVNDELIVVGVLIALFFVCLIN